MTARDAVRSTWDLRPVPPQAASVRLARILRASVLRCQAGCAAWARCPGSRDHWPVSVTRVPVAVVLVSLLAGALVACAESPASTPPITPGTASAPRAVNIVARDYAFVPSVVDLVPGETVELRVINGGLDVHEAILGDIEVQLAWNAAEAAVADHPPGPTPAVSVPPGLEGLRVVVASGELRTVTWTVPADAPDAPSGWYVGCHIPGHWERGMVSPVRFVGPDGAPLATPPPYPVATPSG